MPKTIPIADLSAPELNVYARLTEAQLRARGTVYRRNAAGDRMRAERRLRAGIVFDR